MRFHFWKAPSLEVCRSCPRNCERRDSSNNPTGLVVLGRGYSRLSRKPGDRLEIRIDIGLLSGGRREVLMTQVFLSPCEAAALLLYPSSEAAASLRVLAC